MGEILRKNRSSEQTNVSRPGGLSDVTDISSVKDNSLNSHLPLGKSIFQPSGERGESHSTPLELQSAMKARLFFIIHSNEYKGHNVCMFVYP